MRACNIRAFIKRDMPGYGLAAGELVTIVQQDTKTGRVLVQSSDRKEFPMNKADVEEASASC